VDPPDLNGAWRTTTDRANNGGAEAVNGIIELRRRIAEASATLAITGYGRSSAADATSFSSAGDLRRSHRPALG
jgi:hypothetical protein